MTLLLIIKFGGTSEKLKKIEGDFDDWTIRLAKIDADEAIIRDARAGDQLPAPESILGAIILGSHSNVTERLPWSERTAEWIRKAHAAKLPLLGICYGHQLIAHALGGVVDFNPKGMELGVVRVSLNKNAKENRLYENMNDFPAIVVHSQSVLTLPEKAVHLASSDMEPNQSFYIHPNVWGVQFHPEFYDKVIEFYIHEFADKVHESQGVDEMLKAVQPTPASTSLLKRFVNICRENSER